MTTQTLDSVRLFLALDTCIYTKRWTAPGEWMRLAHDADIHVLEASSDNECDPLFTPPDALAAWADAAETAAAETGGRIGHFFSGHGSYVTLGLAHPDRRVGDHVRDRWVAPMLTMAERFGAGLGFYIHAFPQSVLHDPDRYQAVYAALIDQLAAIAHAAADRAHPVEVSIEQMYTPHQIPFTIAGAHQLLVDVQAKAGAPLYLTIDTGHQVGQARFQRPDEAAIEAFISETAESSWWADESTPRERSALAAWLDAHAYLFAAPIDSDLTAWLVALGAHSPIIHLQQTDGTASGHRPFDARHNVTGIVTPERVLRALADVYRAPEDPSLPPRVNEIHLTLELFAATMDLPGTITRAVNESAAYWRQALPRDGMTLGEALASNGWA